MCVGWAGLGWAGLGAGEQQHPSEGVIGQLGAGDNFVVLGGLQVDLVPHR